MGCDAVPVGDPGAPNQRPSPNFTEFPPVSDRVIEDEVNNNEFDQAQLATLPADGEFTIQGQIDSLDDIDFFALGPAVRGDKITVDVTGSGGINTVVCLFDGEMNIIDANDDRSYYSGLLDPYASDVLRRDTSNLYVGIALSSGRYFASTQGRHTGGYSIKLGRKTAQSVRESTNQLVWLDFEGGDSVTIAQQPVEQMRPFTAESISGRLSGQTDYIANLAVEHMRHDLEPYNVTLVSSKEAPEPTEPHSTLFFGNVNQSFLGLADSVDTGNNIPVQEAIIYTEDLARWESMSPSAEEVGLAIANIAAHELGHLLGMEHTEEPGDMMAIATSAGQVLDMDATYRQAQLEPGVFPVGWQDSNATLLQNVGTRSGSSTTRMMLQDLMPVIPPQRADDIPIDMCGQCCGSTHE
jgi:hypothetical protein